MAHLGNCRLDTKPGISQHAERRSWGNYLILTALTRRFAFRYKTLLVCRELISNLRSDGQNGPSRNYIQIWGALKPRWAVLHLWVDVFQDSNSGFLAVTASIGITLLLQTLHRLYLRWTNTYRRLYQPDTKALIRKFRNNNKGGFLLRSAYPATGSLCCELYCGLE